MDHQHIEDTAVRRPYYRGQGGSPNWLMSDLIDADSLAELMGIHRHTLDYKLAQDPHFPKSLRLGRFNYYSRENVKRWVEGRLGIGDDD